MRTYDVVDAPRTVDERWNTLSRVEGINPGLLGTASG
jgi:hypothetical protein